MKLWDKGYDIDGFTESFTIGKDRELDVMLAGADVIGNLAHLKMLHAVGLVNEAEYKSLQRALVDIHGMVERGEFVIEEGIEDVHSQIELVLVRECGDAGKKIHTGRSRNDQVLLDLKLFTREAIFETLEHIERLFDLLIRRAGENKDVLIPGYTHLQVAMPSSFGLWFGAYAESLADDLLALKAAYDMVYAQMQRGKMEKNVLFGLAAVATTLGRLAADVCLFACSNFGFVRLPDKYTTGSSIMPHKKNPDIFELIRAKCNHLQSLPMQMAMICTNLTSGYFRDMQLTKELFLPAFQELNDSLFMAHLVLQEMEVKRDVLRDPRYTYIFSVEDVNERVMAGIPFREAYREIGMQIQKGSYRDGVREIHHTHEGSMGNLCLTEIKDKFEQRVSEWDITTVREAIEGLLGNRL